MPKDPRSIGEKLAEIDRMAQQASRERGMAESPGERGKAESSESKSGQRERKPYVTGRDPGDEEPPRGSTSRKA